MSASSIQQPRVPKFYYLMIAATLVPLIATPLGIVGGVNDFLDQYETHVYSLVLGQGHVAATAFFFYDRSARPIVKENRVRFIYLPLFLCAIFTLYLYLTGLEGAPYLVCVNIIYLFFHYQKQNFGLISLANQGFKGLSVPLIKAIIFVPMIAGMTAYSLHVLKGSALYELLGSNVDLLFALGKYLYMAGAILAAFFLVRFWRRLNPRSMFFMASSFLFFSPFYLFQDNAAMAFGSIAAAHGAQYVLIMAFTIAGLQSSVLVIRVFVVICCTLFLLEFLTSYFLLVGVLMGLTWGHYLIDARMWKLSLPDSREYIFSRIRRYI